MKATYVAMVIDGKQNHVGLVGQPGESVEAFTQRARLTLPVRDLPHVIVYTKSEAVRCYLREWNDYQAAGLR